MRPDQEVPSRQRGSAYLKACTTGTRLEQVIAFAPSSILVLFTDGLVERRGETFDTGLDQLTAALKSTTTTDPASLCEALVNQAPAVRSDDTAILCAFLT